MKLSIIQKLKQTNSLRQDFVFRIIVLTITLSFIFVGTSLFVYQYNNKLENISRREAIQKIISNNLISSAKYGDIIYSRAESIQLGKDLGLIDLGICIKNQDIFERVNDSRCKNLEKENIEKTRTQIALGTEKYEIEFSWTKEDISLSKAILVALSSSLVISLFIVFPTFYYLLNKFHSKVNNVILKMLDRHNEEIESNHDQLEQDIPEEFKDLDNIIKKKNNELRKATSEKVYYDLSKKVSHDIRSPLNVLNEFSQKITSTMYGDEIIFKHAISRINSIAEDLLKSNKQMGYTKALLSTKEIYLNTTNLTKEKGIEFASKKIVIEVIDDGIDINQNIWIDMSIYLRILSNLINNAQEAIEICRESKEIIQIKMKSIADYLSIQIIDNGIGLSEDLIAKIKRAEGGISFKGKGGNGIGLSSAIQYLKFQGGYLDIFSKEGAGCKINLFLIANDSSNTPVANKKQIFDFIFIDDEQINHLMWKKKAQQHGLNGVYLKTVEECFELNLPHKDIPIFLDYFLDNRNGIFEAERLAQRGFNRIFICTNFQIDNQVLPSYIQGVVEKEFQLSKIKKD